MSEETYAAGDGPAPDAVKQPFPFDSDLPTQSMQAAGTGSARVGDQIGRYKLLQLIGEGGFGSVFVAQQLHPVRRRVAVKILKVGMDTAQLVARFEAERQALAMMDHPNIAKVLDGGATPAGRPYFVMELVRGIPITQYCDQNKLDIPTRLELFKTVCHAVQHAHQKGIIHRDLKPSNILVAAEDGKHVPKVIDFGISKALHGRLTDKTVFTAYSELIGTPQYMSPEQAEMSTLDIDTRSDVYTLGIILYELLTGTTPIDAEKLRNLGYPEIQRLICDADPPRPSTKLLLMGDLATKHAVARRTEPTKLSHLLRGELDWIVMRCLERDRARRYETANSLAMDVHRYLSQEAILAKPPSTSYRIKKTVRRHRGAFLSATAAVLALVLGLTVALYEAARARREKLTAQENEIRASRGERSARANAELAKRNAMDAENARGKATKAAKDAEVALALSKVLEGRTFQLNNEIWQNLTTYAYSASPAQQFARDEWFLTAAWRAEVGERHLDPIASYNQAADLLAKNHESALAADVGLLEAYMHSPPALCEFPRTRVETDLPASNHAAIGLRLAARGRKLVYFRDGAIQAIDLPVRELHVQPLPLAVQTDSFHERPAVAFTEDGRLAAVAFRTLSDSGTTRPLSSEFLLWNLEQDKMVARWRLPAERSGLEWVGSFPDIHVGINADGSKTVLSDNSANAVLCDATNGNVLERFPKPKGSRPDALTPSTNSTRANWAKEGSRIAGALGTFDTGFRAEQNGLVCVAPDGSQALWRDHTPLLTPFASPGGRDRWLLAFVDWLNLVGVFSADGHRVITGENRSIRVRESSTSTEIFSFPTSAVVRGMAVGDDASLLLSTCADGSIQLWPTRTSGQGVTVFPVQYAAAALSRDGRLLFTSDRQTGWAVLWDIASARPLRVLSAARESKSNVLVNSILDISDDCRFVLRCTALDVSVWETSSGRMIAGFQLKKPAGIRPGTLGWAAPNFAGFLSHSQNAFALTLGERCIVFGLDGKEQRSFGIANGFFGYPRLSSDRQRLFSWDTHFGSGHFDIIEYNLARGEKLRTSGPFPLPRYAPRLITSADGQFVISQAGPSVEVYETASRRKTLVLTGKSEGRFDKPVVSSNGSLLAVYEMGVGHQLFDLHAQRELWTYPSGGDFVFAPDAKQLVDSSGIGVLLRNLEWPAKYREHEAELKSVMPTGTVNPHDAKALRILGEWYAFRGVPDWAAEVLGMARAAGGHVPALTLARSYWKIGKTAEALREFRLALDGNEAPELYLRLCMSAVAHPADVGNTSTRPSPSAAAQQTITHENQQPAPPCREARQLFSPPPARATRPAIDPPSDATASLPDAP